MKEQCEWCHNENIRHDERTVYWELPDGTRAVEIGETPSVICGDCGMIYQEDSIIKEIEDQLLLIDTKDIEERISYRSLMNLPRILKRNYFDFFS